MKIGHFVPYNQRPMAYKGKDRPGEWNQTEEEYTADNGHINPLPDSGPNPVITTGAIILSDEGPYISGDANKNA